MDWRAILIEAAKLMLALAIAGAIVGLTVWRIRQ